MNSDSLFINQTELYEILNKFLTNIKKDGAERKTIDNYRRKAGMLEAYWQDYQENHRKMCEFADFDHVYFKKGCFETVQDIYIKIKEVIDNTLGQLGASLQQESPRGPKAKEVQPLPGIRVMQCADHRASTEETTQPLPGTSSRYETRSHRGTSLYPEGGSSKLNGLIKKQNINFKAFMRTVSNIQVDAIENQWQFENALKSLDSRWGEIDKLHWEIEGEDGGDDMAYQMEFSRHEERYSELTNDINQKMWAVRHREKSAPKIDIPVFNGAYNQWVSFKDLFREAIDKNPSMSNAQKMQFLKGKVTGEAERLIHHLQISSENYQVCWEILNHRYGNKKLIFTTHIELMLSVPSTQQQSLATIKKLHDITKETLHAVQNVGAKTESWDPLLVHLLSQKLDNETYTEYIESVKNPRELPVLQEFLEFLETKFTALEASRRKKEPVNQKTTPQQPYKNHYHNQNQKKSFYRNNHQSENKDNSKSNMNAYHVSRSPTCVLCNAEHGLWRCPDFLQMTHEQKLNKIEQLNYCKNCLCSHNKKPCQSNKRCRKCLATHNTLLHEALANQSPTESAEGAKNNIVTKKSTSRSSHVSWDDMSEILLATAIVKVKGVDGTQHEMRALVDQGSQLSLINENAAQTLGLKRAHFKGQIFGVGEKQNNAKGMLQVTLQSANSEFTCDTNVIIMNNLIKRLPNTTFTIPTTWNHIQGIQLADPEFHISRPVDMLLGADVYSKIMLGGILRGDKDEQPIAQQTQLGWLLCGSMKPYYQCNVVLNNTEDLLKFWENEDINQKIEMSNDDHECLQHFINTTKRLEDGRYEVRLPLKPEYIDKLGETKPQAAAQFRNLEKKFERNTNLKADYQKFMDEYVTLNHMVPCNNNQTPEYYLPHHAVIRAESTTTKLRVVFNASARSSTGYSLNDVMYRGPNIQKDLQELILKWRQFQFVYTSDIEKMYRMIRVHQEDQPYQKILWRETKNQPLKSFQLVTLTYGTKPAGFLAMMCLKQLASDERQNFPDAAKELENSFFMDDFCGGRHSIEAANKLKSDLIKLCRKGGFNLRKWTSNKPELLTDLEREQCNQSTYEFKQTDSTKTLGLCWNPQKDNFTFSSKIEPESTSIVTKRTLLSDISKLFDPLGWLTPLSTTMKLLFQNVWLSKLKWDDRLPEAINSDWTQLKQEFADINSIEVNRWLGMGENQNIELYGFCDASNKAYACVIYCKVVNNDKTTITLVAGKARLAPLSKALSIPRLELMGAQLLAQLMQKVQGCLSDYHTNVHCWTDSTAVLGWIQGDPARWKPFVANRVKTITKTIAPKHWQYVKTADNPADCASRGLTMRQLKNHKLWWQGPSWLPSYTNKENQQTIYETNLEARTSIIKQTNAIVIGQSNKSLITETINYLMTTYSSITKIIRILAWILRLSTVHKRVRRPYLELHELRRAKHLIIKSVQQTEFADDVNHLNKHEKVHCKSKILSLNPTIDEHGILRVGGRLENAHISREMKHPIILPHHHRLTTLLIDQAHKLTFHGGARLTLANLRQQFWIIGGYMATKKFIRKCVVCRKQNPIRQYQLMGDLPEPRVNPEQAFYHCGVDYTGFFEVKANKGRGIKTTKGYIAVFVCMVTKAVHLELVSDLSSSAFLAALTRMAARKGAPRHMYSDNGTNFVGANRMIQEEHNQLQQVFSDSFLTEITEMGIEWHFNVPSWPNAGGLWERAVRSLKHHLKRVIGQQRLTFEEYSTLLARLEACLNSRPLCALTEDPDDISFLTPAHFLSGRPGTTIIETDHDARTRWHLTSKLFQDLWKRWKNEYLVQLSARSKWTEPQKNISIGDLVVIHDENHPPGKWALGRVIDTHPGNDGLTRAVSLKTKNGTMKRPIVKLSVLPINKDNATIAKPDEKPATSVPNRKRKLRSKISTVATVLLSLFMLIFPTYGFDDIKPFPSNQTLYFDPISKVQLIRDKWTLVMYYDMGPYWTGITTYNKLANYQEQLCATIETQSHCNTIVQQARHDYQELEYYNELLLTQHFDVHARRRRATGKTGRRRRGLINGIGYLANDLFGVLDSRFADQYEKDIETIHRNEKHLSNLWKNQTSIIEAEFNLMKKMELTVNKQHKLINKKLMDLQQNESTLQREIQNISYVNDFTLSAMSGNSLLQGLRRLQDTLLDALTDIYHGQISIHLLPPTQLKRELQTIYGQMPSELTLPITNLDSDLQYLYKLLKVKARATQKYVIIEVTFPLVSRESFKLYKVIPIPHQKTNSMTKIIPVSEYVAVNLKKDSYFSMTTNELTACLHHGLTYMCQSLKPILDLKNDNSFCDMDSATNKCRVEKSKCTNKWTELHSTSQHLYFCCDTYTIKIICGDHVTIRQLSRAGVIGISQECVIKGKDFSLYSLRHQSNQINIAPTIYMPEFDQINHLVNIKIPDEKQTDDGNLTMTITSLGEAIEKLKTSDSEIEDISRHDIHQYVICYGLMSIALCVAAVWMWRTRRCHICCKAPAGHSGEGSRKQDTTATPPPPRPRRRSVSRHQQELAAAPLPPNLVEQHDYSEVLSAKDLNDKSEIGFRLHNYAKRWPSARYSAIKRDKNTDSGIQNSVFSVEDSIV